MEPRRHEGHQGRTEQIEGGFAGSWLDFLFTGQITVIGKANQAHKQRGNGKTPTFDLVLLRITLRIRRGYFPSPASGLLAGLFQLAWASLSFHAR